MTPTELAGDVPGLSQTLGNLSLMQFSLPVSLHDAADLWVQNGKTLARQHQSRTHDIPDTYNLLAHH